MERIPSEAGSQDDTFTYVRYTPNPEYKMLCDFAEIEIIGKITLSASEAAKTCAAKLMRGNFKLG